MGKANSINDINSAIDSLREAIANNITNSPVKLDAATLKTLLAPRVERVQSLVISSHKKALVTERNIVLHEANSAISPLYFNR